MQDVVAEAKALESARKANELITDETKGIEEQGNWMSHKQMKLKLELGTCFRCGDRRGPHPWKTCPANGKTCMKCGVTATSPESVSRQVPLNKNNHKEQPNGMLRARVETTKLLAACANRNPLMNKTYILCRRQMINTLWNTTPMTTKNSGTPCKQGKYTVSTQAKKKVLCCPAQVCNWEQIHPGNIRGTQCHHLQYLA